MPPVAAKPRTPATVYDNALRYFVPSRRTSERYLTELDAYAGNGRCSCPDFTKHLEKYLQRGVTPDQALAEAWVKQRDWQQPWDVLRCWHLVEARSQFADDMITALTDAQKAHQKHPNAKTHPTETPF